LRASALFAPTLRQAPQGIALRGQALLLRGAFANRFAGGAYGLLPLGAGVMGRISDTVREKMRGMGASPVTLPAMASRPSGGEAASQPAPVSGAAPRGGGKWAHIKSVHFDLCREMVAAHARSYGDLPILAYDTLTWSRADAKASLGLLGASESLETHVWAFCADGVQLAAMHQRAAQALGEVVAGCGLEVLEAKAWDEWTEKMTLLVWEHESGPLQVVHCGACGWAADVEGATCAAVTGTRPAPAEPMAEVVTPNATTVAAVTEMLGIGAERLVKTLIYVADGRLVAALVRGDHELDEAKWARALDCLELRMATAPEIEQVTGGPVGFSGPVGLKGIEMVGDYAVSAMADFVTGANAADKHLRGVNLDRDFTVDRFADLRRLDLRDPCPSCGGRLAAKNGFALGGVASLRNGAPEFGTPSVQAMDGSRVPILVLEAWLDLTRVMAASAEAHCGENGIVWPVRIAPFQVHLLLLDASDAAMSAAADSLYQDMQANGLDVLYDDRDERAGVKFHDADLFGIPYVVVIGRRLEREGLVEVRTRASGAECLVAPERVPEALRGELC